MAFGMGGGSPDEMKGDINVTPLVDVCLVLLIIFMVVTPMLQSGVDVLLPEGEHSAKKAGKEGDLIISIKQDGTVFVGQDWIPDRNLVAFLRAEHQKNPARAVMLKADKRINYGKVRMVMQAANEAEFTGVSILTANKVAGVEMAQGEDVTVAFGGGGKGVQSEINITPLVDVVLVLLIIFMVATPILQMGLDVEVPPKVEVATPPPQSQQNQLVITVKGDGVYLNAQKMASVSALRDALAPQMLARPAAERVVFINAEDRIVFQTAVEAMDAARQAGAHKVGFLTDPPK